jgi:hypothetical protein
MHWKKASVIILVVSSSFISACVFSSQKKKSIKDFDQHMLDLRIYHENPGDALLAKNQDYAIWFVNDMDSILILMADEFTEHRKLRRPFKYHYRRKMASTLKDLRKEIEISDWKNALNTYSILTRNCNGCHVDHDIDKEVKDVTRQ